jgi:translation elongation factor EF-1beta
MGSTVGVLYKIYPKEDSADAVSKALKDVPGFVGSSLDEIGFGIKVVKAFFKFEDKTSTSTEIEEKLKKLPGVSEVEVMEESLL